MCCLSPCYQCPHPRPRVQDVVAIPSALLVPYLWFSMFPRPLTHPPTQPQVPTSLLPSPAALEVLSPGQLVGGRVTEVADDHLWLALSPGVRGRVFLLDAASQPGVLAGFSSFFRPGQALAAHVVSVDAKKRQLDLSLLQPLLQGPAQQGGQSAKKGSKKRGADGAPAGAAGAFVPAATLMAAAAAGGVGSAAPPGSLVMGRITGAKGCGGLLVTLGGKASGRVALSDIHDTWVPNALEGLEQGAFVRCCVLGVEEAGAKGALVPGGQRRLQLSLRPSRGGAVSGARWGLLGGVLTGGGGVLLLGLVGSEAAVACHTRERTTHALDSGNSLTPTDCLLFCPQCRSPQRLRVRPLPSSSWPRCPLWAMW